MSEVDEVRADEPAEDPVWVRSFAMDARLDEATALIDACREDSSLRSDYRSALREASLLENLGIGPSDPEASQAIEDAAAVVAAYAIARGLADPKAPTNATVRKLLETVIEQAGKIESAERKIGSILQAMTLPNARGLLEEAAVKFGVGHLLPADGNLSAAQRLAKQAGGSGPRNRPLTNSVRIGHVHAARQDGSFQAQDRPGLRQPPRLKIPGIRTSPSRASRPGEDGAGEAAAETVTSGLISPRAPANAAARRLLATVTQQFRCIEVARRRLDDILKDQAATHARMLLEEAALRIAVRHLVPVDRNLPTFQRFAKQAGRVRLLVLPLAKGMLIRHGREILVTAGRCVSQPGSLAAGVSAARRHGMTDELAKTVAGIAEGIPDSLSRQDMVRPLREAARAALTTLLHYSELSAYVVPPANLVVALGALELFCAWLPERRPKTSVNTPIEFLIENLRLAGFPNIKMNEIPREALLKVVGAWKAGRPAFIFDGRDSSRQKRRGLLRNFQLDPNYSVSGAKSSRRPANAAGFLLDRSGMLAARQGRR